MNIYQLVYADGRVQYVAAVELTAALVKTNDQEDPVHASILNGPEDEVIL